MEKWGIYSLDFPQSSPQGISDDKKNAGLKAQSSLWFPLAWVAGAQAKGKPQGKWGVCSPDFPQSSPQEILENGKSLLFSHGIWGELWGNLGSKPPFCLWIPLAWVVWGPNLLGVLPPQPALRNFQGFWGEPNSQNPLKGGDHPIHPGQR